MENDRIDHIADPGLWVRVDPRAVEPGRGALFLDRDGVILEEVEYLHRLDDFKLIDGAAEAIALANRNGAPVVVVTNQSGVGRGFYGWGEFAEIERALERELTRRGAKIDMTVACAYHSEARAPFNLADHPCRKPSPGMFFIAKENLGVDLKNSFMIGDKISDLLAARSAGLGGAALVLTGHGKERLGANRASLDRLRAQKNFALSIDSDILAATKRWLQNA